jgi:RNA polymerase sigma factor (sigma-70 family)
MTIGQATAGQQFSAGQEATPAATASEPTPAPSSARTVTKRGAKAESASEREGRIQARRKRDCELMARIAVGDADAFAELWHHYRRWLSFHLYRRNIVDVDASNDILQDVCLRILRWAHKYDRNIATVGTWLILMTDNAVYAYRVKHRRHANYHFIRLDEKYELTSEDHFDVNVNRDDTKGLLTLALKRLAPMLREVLELRYFEGLEVPAIAARQRVPDYTVRGRIERGVKELRWHYRAELKSLGAGFVEAKPTVPRLISRFLED